MAVTERNMLERCDKKTLRLNFQLSICVRAVLSYSYHLLMKECVASAKFMVEKKVKQYT